MVVDDQPANIQVVGSVLGKLGYEIIPALDGATALKKMAKSVRKNVRKNVDEYTLPGKRRLNLLADGRLVNLACAECI